MFIIELIADFIVELFTPTAGDPFDRRRSSRLTSRRSAARR
jgi:hypothetical protein